MRRGENLPAGIHQKTQNYPFPTPLLLGEGQGVRSVENIEEGR